MLSPPRQPIVGGMGSHGGSVLGSQAESTGLGDGEPGASSQGLAGAQGSGGGADRGGLQNPGTGPYRDDG